MGALDMLPQSLRNSLDDGRQAAALNAATRILLIFLPP